MTKRDLVRTYIIVSMLNAASVSFSMSTYVSFLISKGLDLFQINLVNAVYFATILVFEIITGAYADTRGRKKSFLVSTWLRGMACPMIYAASHSLPMFLLAEFVGAIGSTFASGAFTAWFVDELLHHGGSDEERKKAFATSGALSTLVVCPVAALLGGYLGSLDLRLPWMANAVCALILFVIAKKIMKENAWTSGDCESLLGTAKEGAVFVAKAPYLWALMLTGLIHTMCVQAPNMQWQPFFRPLLVTPANLGVLGSCMLLTVGLGSIVARRKFSMNSNFLLMVTQAGVGLGIAAAGLFGGMQASLVLFLVHEVFRGVFPPIHSTLLHENLPKAQRATIDSFDSMIRHGGGLIGLLVSGWMASHYGISVTWIFSGMCLALGGGVLWKFRK